MQLETVKENELLNYSHLFQNMEYQAFKFSEKKTNNIILIYKIPINNRL